MYGLYEPWLYEPNNVPLNQSVSEGPISQPQICVLKLPLMSSWLHPHFYPSYSSPFQDVFFTFSKYVQREELQTITI